MLSNDEKRLIYSRRFPENDLNALYGSVIFKKDNPPEPPITYEEFCRKIAEKSVYVIDPEKVRNQQKLIDLAVKFSTEYEIDMDIEEHAHFISILMYLTVFFCSGSMKPKLEQLIAMSDRISCFTPKNDPCELILSLDYNTHIHYLNGRKVED